MKPIIPPPPVVTIEDLFASFKPGPYVAHVRQPGGNLGPGTQNLSVVSLNKRLREAGFSPIAWAGSETRLLEAGVTVTAEPDAYVSAKHKTPGMADPKKHLWAPTWAVLVTEADPCNEAARDWALSHAVKDDEFRAALETVAGVGDRRKMADFIMAMWEP